MSRDIFDADVRPGLTEIPIGARGVGFDRLELDAWAGAYISARGRRGRNKRKDESCELEPRAFCSKVPSELPTSGTEVKGSSKGSVKSARKGQKIGSEIARPDSITSEPSNFERALNACGLRQPANT